MFSFEGGGWGGDQKSLTRKIPDWPLFLAISGNYYDSFDTAATRENKSIGLIPSLFFLQRKPLAWDNPMHVAFVAISSFLKVSRNNVVSSVLMFENYTKLIDYNP